VSPATTTSDFNHLCRRARSTQSRERWVLVLYNRTDYSTRTFGNHLILHRRASLPDVSVKRDAHNVHRVLLHIALLRVFGS